MPNRIHVAFVAAVLATAAFGIAQTTPVIKQVPVRPTSPASGKQMYTTYCAVCHGVDGKGNGPAAAALKDPPTNLVQLSRDNGGKFPDTHIYSVLQFGMENPAHGSAGHADLGSCAPLPRSGAVRRPICRSTRGSRI